LQSSSAGTVYHPAELLFPLRRRREYDYYFFSRQPSGIAALRPGSAPAIGLASPELAFEETPTL